MALMQRPVPLPQETMMGLKHKHLLPCIGFSDEERDYLCLVLPLCDGSLASSIIDLDALQRVDVLRQAASGLQYMHIGRGLLDLRALLLSRKSKSLTNGLYFILPDRSDDALMHLDVKPDNVLITRRPHGGIHAFLADFGSSRLLKVWPMLLRVKNAPTSIDSTFSVT